MTEKKMKNLQIPKLLKGPEASKTPTSGHSKIDFSVCPSIKNYQTKANHPPAVKKTGVSIQNGEEVLPQNENSDSHFFYKSKSLCSNSFKNKNRNKRDHLMNEFLELTNTNPLYLAIENFLRTLFNGSTITYWEPIPSLHSLFSASLNKVCPDSEGLISQGLKSKEPITLKEGFSQPNYNCKFDKDLIVPNSPILIFSLKNYFDENCGVVCVTRSQNSLDYDSGDVDNAQWFSNKFRLLSKFLLTPQPINQLLLSISSSPPLQVLRCICTQLSSFFHCRSAEIWSKELNSDTIFKIYSNDNSECIQFPTLIRGKGGIAAEALRHEENMNVGDFSQSSDPRFDLLGESVLVVTTKFNLIQDENLDEKEISHIFKNNSKDQIYGIVLRGSSASVFTQSDEITLRNISPFLFQLIVFSQQYLNMESELNKLRSESEALLALLEVAELLSAQLDYDNLPQIIMEKGLQLTNADRCSLFLIVGNELQSSFAHGLKKTIRIPKDKGIAGQTVKTSEIMNIKNAYENDIFDKSVDLLTGYQTKSILAVPIMNTEGEVIGVTEMINKKSNDECFNTRDEKIIQIFNVFCGIALENSKLYKEKSEMTIQLRSFFDISFSLSKSEDILKLISDIFANARKAIGAEKAALFLADENVEVLKPFIYDGFEMPSTIPINDGIIGQVAMTKKPLILNDPETNPLFTKSMELFPNQTVRHILAVPLINFNQNNKLQGVCEMINSTADGFTEKDLRILTAFASFAELAFENSRLKEIATYGNEEVELTNLIGETERKFNENQSIPVKLRASPHQIECFNSRYYFAYGTPALAPNEGNIGAKYVDTYRLLFHIFYSFNLLTEFKINNDQFFRFIHSMRQIYTDTSYHNWFHACDVTQYCFYELLTIKGDQIYNKRQIYALLVAAICHDANHAGFNNVYNLKAQTPLGILFQNQSVMETYHCSMSIPIITRPQVSLFASLEELESREMWQNVFHLILATDMAHHFELVKKAQLMCEEKASSNTNSTQNLILQTNDEYLLTLQLLLKVADISNVSRPFKIADYWCDLLNLEFFRQGDLEKEKGIGLTSPLNDREKVDKPKSQIGFYNFICLPLYQTLAKIFPPLEINVEAVKANLDIWKSLTEEKKD